MAYLNSSDTLNGAEPEIMHIDLNSAFATIEQQAKPLLRGKPVGVCSYITPGGIILAASYEAKAKGITTGTVNREARLLCPEIVLLMPDPDKYFYVNARLYSLLYQYTDNLVPLSIDEFVIDFSKSRKIHSRPLVEIAAEIKARIRKEIGSAIRVNIGLGTNRFLAKTAAGLHKPDGLDIINAKNLRSVYESLHLRDLCGISYRFEARLNVEGIYSPIDFLDTPVEKLHKQVFRSIEGYRWYQRLRGWEVDNVSYGRKSFGNDFAIYRATDDKKELSQLIMKLCEKTGRRLRKGGYYARGAQLWLLYENHSYWHKSMRTNNILYSTHDIYAAMQRLYNLAPNEHPIAKLGVSVYGLKPTDPEQLELFDTIATKQRDITQAVDLLNNRYGEFTVAPAQMMYMDDRIIKRVPFGASKDLAGMYQEQLTRFL